MRKLCEEVQLKKKKNARSQDYSENFYPGLFWICGGWDIFDFTRKFGPTELHSLCSL